MAGRILQVRFTMCGCGSGKVMHTTYGWQATWDHNDFSELLVKEVPAQLIQEKRDWGAAHHSHLYDQLTGQIEV